MIYTAAQIDAAIAAESLAWAKFFKVDPTAEKLAERARFHRANLALDHIGELAEFLPKTFSATGNWGELVCDIVTGNVVNYDRGGDWEKPGDGYDDITRLDADEWRATYLEGDITAGHDILDFGSWDKSGLYVGPESDWRFNLWLDRENDTDSKWRIVPRLGDKAKAEFAAWLRQLPADHYISPAKALGMLESRQ